jgi:hypothetical protein
MSEIIATLIKYGLSAIAIVVVLVASYLATSSSKAATESSNIAELYANTSKLYNTGASTSGLNNAAVLAADTEPSSMNVGGSLLNPWGGAVTVAGDATIPTGIDISDTGVPQSACTSEATSIATVTSVSVNGGAALAQPVDPATVAQECTSSTNSINFVFTN